jgi:hypothetical protein
MGRFEFVVLSRLRAHQLTRGCLSRVEGVHVRAVTAQMEVAGGYVVRMAAAAPIGADHPIDIKLID